MSQRKLLIEIDAEDKYCGECDNWNFIHRCPIFKYALLKSDMRGNLLRCQACLDAEGKVFELNDFESKTINSGTIK